MPPNFKKIIPASLSSSKRIMPIFVVIVLGLIIGGFFLLNALVSSGGKFTVSGTIEATVVHLGSETGGRVRKVDVKEGETVIAGQTLVDFYPVNVANSQGVGVVVRSAVTSPLDGVVLERSIEPGEIASPGSTLIAVTNLDELNLTVYVPEDRYGLISLGQVYDITVDSFPGEVFKGKVSHIADKAEFTPRNVQTTDSRKTTVFAIRLNLEPTGGKLKPGMPADVQFQAVQ